MPSGPISMFFFLMSQRPQKKPQLITACGKAIECF